MKLITKSELKQLTPLKPLHDARSPLIDLCESMKVGQALFIGREEWTNYGYAKNVKPKLLLLSSRLKGRIYKVIDYKEGWVIKRKK